MQEIEVHTSKIRLNFWEQMEKAFLMDASPLHLFNFISQSKEQEMMAEYQKTQQVHLQEVEKDIKDNEMRMDILTQDIGSLEEKAEELKKFVEFDVDYFTGLVSLKANIETQLGVIEEAKPQIKSLKETIKGKDVLIKEVSRILGEVKDKGEKLDKINLALTKYRTASKIQEEAELLIKESKQTIIDTKNILEKLKGIIDKHSELTTFKENILEAENKLIIATTLKSDSIENIEDIKKDKQRLEFELNKFKVCPFCGSDLTDSPHTHT